MKYEEMLDEGMKGMPEIVASTERLEIPKVTGHIEGNKTIVTNFNAIVSVLRRDSQHFLKYLLKEVAAPGYLSGGRLIIGRKVSSSLLNIKIKEYVDRFVLCSVCGKPDTALIDKENVTYLKCTACGNQREIKL